MSLTEPELRLRERQLARREQVLHAREAELTSSSLSLDRFDALLREFAEQPTPNRAEQPAPERLQSPLASAAGLLGIWLLASPVVLGLATAVGAWSCILCGAALAVAAATRLTHAAHPLPPLMIGVVSVLLIACALSLDSAREVLNCAVTGALGLASALAPPLIARTRRRRAGARRRPTAAESTPPR